MSGKKKDNSWSWRRLRFRERQAFLYIDGKLTMFKKKKKVQMQGIEKIIIKGSWEEEVEWIRVLSLLKKIAFEENEWKNGCKCKCILN